MAKLDSEKMNAVRKLKRSIEKKIVMVVKYLGKLET